MPSAAVDGSSVALRPEEWPDRYGDLLYRVALGRVRHAETAADLVQETFLAALRSASTFRGDAREATWLVGILKHKVTDHFRRVGRAERALPRSAAPFDDEGWWQDEPGTWDAGPDVALEREEFWELLGRCVADLPEPLAAAFSLHELDERPGQEVCQELGIAATNLWTRLHRARLLLRACLERRWFGKAAGGSP